MKTYEQAIEKLASIEREIDVLLQGAKSNRLSGAHDIADVWSKQAQDMMEMQKHYAQMVSFIFGASMSTIYRDVQAIDNK